MESVKDTHKNSISNILLKGRVLSILTVLDLLLLFLEGRGFGVSDGMAKTMEKKKKLESMNTR